MDFYVEDATNNEIESNNLIIVDFDKRGEDLMLSNLKDKFLFEYLNIFYF